MPLDAEALRRHPIHLQARIVLTDPDAAVAAGETARRFAWLIRASQRGATVVQRHRPANTTQGPRE